MNTTIDRRAAQTYPVHIRIDTRFTETDMNAHINNVSFLLYYEDAQAEFLLNCFPELATACDWNFRLARCDVAYDGQGYYPDAVDVATGVEHIDDSWLRVSQALFQRGSCIGQCDAILIKVNAQGQAMAIDAEQRARLAGYVIKS